MELFEEISKSKQDFPKKKTITDDFSKYHFNFYQIFARTSRPLVGDELQCNCGSILYFIKLTDNGIKTDE